MITDHFQAWIIAIGATALLYGLFLHYTFPLIRARRHLAQRWGAYRGDMRVHFDNKAKRIEDKRLRSLQGSNALKDFLANPYPTLKKIKFLFYRSNFFPHIKTHIAGQMIGAALATEILFMVSKISLVKACFLGTFSSLLVHFFILKFKESAWQKAFITVFPVSLDIINRGLKSGMTLGRGIAMVSEEVEDPVGSEFNYIASQLQLGIPPDVVLNEASERIGIDEFRFFTLALIIQREMGGSLADILKKLSEVIRERDRFRKKVWILSAESRASTWIVGSLPLFLAVIVEFITPGYTKFFITDPKGQIMLWACIGLTLTGVVVIARMMKVED